MLATTERIMTQHPIGRVRMTGIALLTAIALSMCGCRLSATAPPSATDTARTTVAVAAVKGTPAARAPDAASAVIDAAGTKGGLVVVIGCHGPSLLSNLRGIGPYLVHCIDSDPGRIAAARRHLREKGLYGPVTVSRISGAQLPFVDSLVNLIVLTDDTRIPTGELDRILAPEGAIADIRKPTVEITRKGRPGELDDWSHYLYDASNNAVSKDAAVDPPRGLRWTCGPKFARSHEHLASLSAMVTAGGRVFTIIDEGPISSVMLPGKWKLVARDAFSGVLLWEHPIANWESQLRVFRSGPPEIGRRIVATSDRLYAALDYGDPVVVLDAATGKQLATLSGTEGARELLFTDQVLYVLADDMTGERHEARRRQIERRTADLGTSDTPFWYMYPKNPIDMYGVPRVLALDGTGNLLWKKDFDAPGEILPGTMAVDGDRVCLQSVSHVICFDASDGGEKWRHSRPAATSRFSWSGPTLVVQDGVVLSVDRSPRDNARTSPPAVGSEWIISGGNAEAKAKGEAVALSLADGKELWRTVSFENYMSPTDVFVIDGVVWIGNHRHKDDPGFTHGRDLHTGEIVATIPGQRKPPGMGHHRCYRNKATVKWLLEGRTWLEFLDPKSGSYTMHPWVRGICQYGIMPANGLIYVPQHSCACNPSELIAGFNALSPSSSYGDERAAVERGPAYGVSEGLTAELPQGSWPTYRADSKRSCYRDLPVPATPGIRWLRDLSAPITAPVAGNGVVIVAETDRHVVQALSATDGSPVWIFAADGRIDSPPTLHDGLCLFGTRNGFVYCLRTSDGELVWRRRVAPRDRRVFAYEQLESVWPVHGSVLVDDTLSDGKPVAYVAAGRSPRMDGGVRLVALEARTGVILHTEVMADGPGRGAYNLGIALPDILSLQKGAIWMRHVGMDKTLTPVKKVRHFFAPRGLLDDTWWHRTYSLYDTGMGAGYFGWPIVSNRSPAGRVLAYDGKGFYGYGRLGYGISPIGHPQVGHIGWDAENLLFSEVLGPKPDLKRWANWTPVTMKGLKEFPWFRQMQWSRRAPYVVKAIVISRNALLVAGAGSLGEASGSHGPGTLRIVARSDGSESAACELPAPPILDGMALTDQGIFVSTIDGSLIALAEEE